MVDSNLKDRVELALRHLTVQELMEFIPIEFIIAAAKGFLTGIEGPKKHKKNNWVAMKIDPRKNLASLLGHIAQLENERTDTDTGFEEVEIFVAARAVMYVTKKIRERKIKEANKDHEDMIKEEAIKNNLDGFPSKPID